MSYLTVIRSHDRKVAINYYYYYYYYSMDKMPEFSSAAFTYTVSESCDRR